ncbi:uncharacterized protein B0H18DRAFT_868004 [Fomitopsis serialis]|uniref:uncharacterized protein n=1 Tax=Fomitopsis serialis TaxID=139415 RepID=UPI0020084665|nr:uncharacterized protein B0H18DRAFT_868004 [Neoantrodia serialis]KAH9936126.1 hypothetical protein B0H18DRAFT_868004 [Neoantrodia serialis]
MIVEALMDTGDPEGAAPKDLFAWMASRYPLQTNFRPSASQALQKAYKRGRLEKVSGKYRLNPSWEGGTTSKRTTRKPQTHAQTTYMQQQPPSSPFTNAPLHHRSNHAPYPQAGPPGQYPSYSYGYPQPGYPQYHTPSLPSYYQQQPSQQPTTASKAPAQSSASVPTAVPAPSPSTTVPTVASSGKDGADKAPTTDGHDANAWEAAQHILEAINFNTLHRIEDPEQPELPAAASAAQTSAPVPAAASMETRPAAEAPRTTLTEDERASLQAQLALLAAQLTEIANESDDEDGEEVEALARAQPVPEWSPATDVQTRLASPMDVQPEATEVREGNPLEEAAGRAMAMLLDNLDSAAQAMAQDEEESDEDEDMEMVEVPTYVGSDALRI